MITIKNVALLVLLLCAGVALSSCEDQMDTIQQDRSASFDVSTRSERSAGGLSVSPQGGLVSEDQFSFDFSATNSMLAKDNVQLYVIFTAPNGGDYPVLMNKSVSGNWVSASLQKTLSQVGTYKVQVAYSVNGGSKTRLDNSQSVIVTSNLDDYNPSNDSGYADSYCTSWVAWKVNQMWGSWNGFYGSSNRNSLGDARNWKNNLLAKGYRADLSPQVGDIAWWEFNHVAFVTQVFDQNSVKITEYNNLEVGKRKQFYSRDLYRRGGKGHKFPDVFIHVQKKR